MLYKTTLIFLDDFLGLTGRLIREDIRYVFMLKQDDVLELIYTISDYISSCGKNIIPSKQVKVFPNNNPWTTKNFKGITNKKRQLFKKETLRH